MGSLDFLMNIQEAVGITERIQQEAICPMLALWN